MANFSNDSLSGYVEHLVPLQEKKVLFPRKLALIAGTVLLLALILVLTVSPLFRYLGGAAFLLLLGGGVLIWYLSRFASVEYEYTILGGEIRFEAIYGRRQRRPCYQLPLSRIERLAPVDGKEAPRFPGVKKTRFYASAMANPRTWYALVREENGEKILLFLELTEKGESALRTLCRRAFF